MKGILVSQLKKYKKTLILMNDISSFLASVIEGNAK